MHLDANATLHACILLDAQCASASCAALVVQFLFPTLTPVFHIILFRRRLHRRQGRPGRAVRQHLRQEAGARAGECREPPRASRTPPDAAALGS